MTLGTLFAASRRIPPEDVEKRLLLESLPWFWRPVIRISGVLGNPAKLKADRGLIRQCLLAHSAKEVLAEVEIFHYRELHFVPSWRRLLGLRVSGQRLLHLATTTFRS